MNMPHCCKLSAVKNPCNCQEKLHCDFIPGPNDVICARGKAAKSHPGNIRYQQIVETYLTRYTKATSKLQKMSIISEIVSKVRICSSPNGGFVKQKEGRWHEVGDHFAREKVSQSLRDSLHVFYRSSCKSKTIRRAIRRKVTETDIPEISLQTRVQESAFVSSLSRPVSTSPSALPAVPSHFPSVLLEPTQDLCGRALVTQQQRALFQQLGKEKCVVAPRSQASSSISTHITESDMMVARILLAQAQSNMRLIDGRLIS